MRPPLSASLSPGCASTGTSSHDAATNSTNWKIRVTSCSRETGLSVLMASLDQNEKPKRLGNPYQIAADEVRSLMPNLCDGLPPVADRGVSESGSDRPGRTRSHRVSKNRWLTAISKPFSIERCRELLGTVDSGPLDEEIEAIRDQTDTLAHVLIDIYLDQQREGRSHRMNAVRSRFGSENGSRWKQTS